MFSGTAVAVTAGADFVIEGAVDFVLFGAEDRGEVVGHDGLWRRGEKEFNYVGFAGTLYGFVEGLSVGTGEWNISAQSRR